MIPGFVVRIRNGMVAHVSNHGHCTIHPDGSPQLARDYPAGMVHRYYREHGRRWLEQLAIEAARELLREE